MTARRCYDRLKLQTTKKYHRSIQPPSNPSTPWVVSREGASRGIKIIDISITYSHYATGRDHCHESDDRKAWVGDNSCSVSCLMLSYHTQYVMQSTSVTNICTLQTQQRTLLRPRQSRQRDQITRQLIPTSTANFSVPAIANLISTLVDRSRLATIA